MPAILRKHLLIIAALLIAAGITYYPWTLMDHFSGAASSVYGMTSLLWAPMALFIGLATGISFAVLLWPRKPKSTQSTQDDKA